MNLLADTRRDVHQIANDPLLTERWEGNMTLEFERRELRTVIAKKNHSGPLTVQQPFYPESDVCHVYLLHPPGGLVGGDRLTINAAAAAQTHALITTPAASKFYRSPAKLAELQQRLIVGENACIEWLPQETIFFAGCHARLDTRIDVAATGRFINWETLCFGRPAAGELFDAGTVEQRLEIWRDGQPSVIERLALTGGDRLQTEAWGLSGYSAVGTMTAGPADVDLVSRVQTLIKPNSGCVFGATLLDDVAVFRCMAAYAEVVRSVLVQVWTVIRPAIGGKTAREPRIWRT